MVFPLSNLSVTNQPSIQDRYHYKKIEISLNAKIIIIIIIINK
jgi:hypothetical protein